MLIQPDTYIRLIKNCPLDKTYDHTIYFESEEKQITYFKNTLQGIPFSKQSYQRYDGGVLHIQEKAENLYSCNYMMFQNGAFGNKWFYAFITSVEYVNNVSSRVYYEIDVMQTWFFDYIIADSYVEREHSVKDIIGENTVPENLDTGEYVASSFEVPMGENDIPILSGKKIIVAATFDKEYKDSNGGEYGGLFSGLTYNVFDNASDCSDFILGAGAKADGIVSVFVMPSAFVIDSADAIKSYEFSIDKNHSPFEFEIQNNKLLTYPYNFLYATNMQGQSAVFPYEFFNDEVCNFTMLGDMSCNPNVIIAPHNYKGVAVNYDEKMVLSGFPQCSYITDTFKAWLAQNAGSLAVSAIGFPAQVANAQHNYTQSFNNPNISYASSQVGGMLSAVSLAASVAGTMVNIAQHSIMPHQAHVGSGSSAMFSAGLITFGFMQKHIKNEFAKIIDEYFNMFGYATHRVKEPNRNSRPHWNYVKTLGCVLHGVSADRCPPSDDMSLLHSIYDRGITFWKNGAEIGKYYLDNKPT